MYAHVWPVMVRYGGSSHSGDTGMYVCMICVLSYACSVLGDGEPVGRIYTGNFIKCRLQVRLTLFTPFTRHMHALVTVHLFIMTRAIVQTCIGYTLPC